MKIIIGTTVFTAILNDNSTVDALMGMLPLTINMIELNGNEKYFYLPVALPTKASNVTTIQAGDIMLYGENCLVLFYKSFKTTYSYTRVGHIENTSGLANSLGAESVTVNFRIE